jgi:hypothetical protein
VHGPHSGDWAQAIRPGVALKPQILQRHSSTVGCQICLFVAIDIVCGELMRACAGLFRVDSGQRKQLKSNS